MSHFKDFSTPSLSALQQKSLFLDQLTTREVEWMKINSPWVALFPLGSVEPHGPHLPLATDRYLSEENARYAAIELRKKDVNAWVVPSCPYGVTEFAHGFDGAITLPPDLFESLLIRLAEQYFQAGCHHLCFINHHLEPKQLQSLNQVTQTLKKQYKPSHVSFPQVVSKRWGRALGAEFRSGACHAGAYEGSMIAYSHQNTVDAEIASALPEVKISLSKAIHAGCDGFLDAGMHLAYTGNPAEISSEEGHRLYQAHTVMVCTEVMESIRPVSD